MDRPACSACGARPSKLWRYQWNNGVIWNEKHYCFKCRKENAPPVREFERQGGIVTPCQWVTIGYSAKVECDDPRLKARLEGVMDGLGMSAAEAVK